MKNLEKISKSVYGKLDENSVVVYFTADLNNIPAFMCSPFCDGWFGSKSTKDLVAYIFEIIVGDFMLDSVMAFGDYDKTDEEDYDFEQSLKVYKEYKSMNDQRSKYLDKIVELYNANINKELSYIEFVKLLCSLEEYAPHIGIELYFESYSTPLDARHSENLSIETFDFEDLNDNF